MIHYYMRQVQLRVLQCYRLGSLGDQASAKEPRKLVYAYDLSSYDIVFIGNLFEYEFQNSYLLRIYKSVALYQTFHM
jgi:hypothetical protein